MGTEIPKKGTELRFLNGHYYLYEVTSKWNPEKKRSQKVTGKLLGKITEKDGFIESEKARLRRQNSISSLTVKEYGFSFLYEQLLGDYTTLLKKHFEEDWQTILALAYGSLLYCSPLKNMSFHYFNSYLSELYSEVTLSPNSLSGFLRALGIRRESIVRFFREFNYANDCIIFDGTDMNSKSSLMYLPKEGKSKRGIYESLIDLMFVFSIEQRLPIYYRINQGNIKDVKAFRLCLEECKIADAVIILDKGFYSKENIKQVKDEQLKFIIPLRRTSSLIDYTIRRKGGKEVFDGYFKFEGRYICYYSYKTEGNDMLHLYLDEKLRVEEGKDFLERIENGSKGYTMEQFNKKNPQFGTIALLTNAVKAPQKIYVDYKSRGEVEQMIDTLKDVVEADMSYMQNEFALEGWMFINYIALHWYYRIYQQLLAKHELNGKFSPKDFISFLTEIKRVKINDKWYTAEITKKTNDLLKKLELPIT
ncbi:MAG: transposase [Bacteroidales bacterium]|nr:transposase [Bacteroidales bacterium]MBP9510958.1 transposase [Bacteroidales bacterium]MDI9574717.1 transposase [Bacteroidota bacterium]